MSSSEGIWFVPPPEPPRVSVQYLFVWTATTAVFLALYMAGPGKAPTEHQPLAIGLHGIRFLASVFYGASLATWLFAIKRRLGWRTAFPSAPGHWICLVMSLKEFVVALAVVIGVRIGEGLEADPSNPFVVLLLVPAIGTVPALAGWMMAGRHGGLPNGWLYFIGFRFFAEAAALCGAMVMLLVIAMGPGSGATFFLYPLLQFFAALCGLLAFITAAVLLTSDLWRRERHDWAHWLGVTTAVATPLLWMLLYFGALTGEIVNEIPRPTAPTNGLGAATGRTGLSPDNLSACQRPWPVHDPV